MKGDVNPYLNVDYWSILSANVRCGHTSPFIYTNLHILCLKLSVFRHYMKHPKKSKEASAKDIAWHTKHT